METAIWQAYQDEGVIMLGIINTSNQNQINNFVIENSLTFPILFDPGSSGGVQGGNTYDDFYMPNDGSPYPRDFIIDQEGIIRYANNEIDTEWMLYVLNDLINNNQILLGDLNLDNTLNILDIVLLSNIVLSGDFMFEGDMNSDNVNNILDIVQLATIIISNINFNLIK